MAYGKRILPPWLLWTSLLIGLLLGAVYQHFNYVRPLTLEERAIQWWQGRTS